MQSKHITMQGMMITVALAASYVESLIPLPIGIPGIKLGLANIVIVVALYHFGEKEAIWIAILRVVLASFLFGNLSMMIYSIAGTICSLFIMCTFKKIEHFSILGVSMAGGVCHNVGQIFVAILVLENMELLYYGAALLLAGLGTGLLIGLMAKAILPRLPKLEEGR